MKFIVAAFVSYASACSQPVPPPCCKGTAPETFARPIPIHPDREGVFVNGQFLEAPAGGSVFVGDMDADVGGLFNNVLPLAEGLESVVEASPAAPAVPDFLAAGAGAVGAAVAGAADAAANLFGFLG